MQPPSMVLFLLLTLIVVLARQVLTPAINAARDAGPTAEHRFRRLHRTSVVLNAFVILLLLIYVLWMASRGY